VKILRTVCPEFGSLRSSFEIQPRVEKQKSEIGLDSSFCWVYVFGIHVGECGSPFRASPKGLGKRGPVFEVRDVEVRRLYLDFFCGEDGRMKKFWLVGCEERLLRKVCLRIGAGLLVGRLPENFMLFISNSFCSYYSQIFNLLYDITHLENPQTVILCFLSL
jgi:hypothetical protein